MSISFMASDALIEYVYTALSKEGLPDGNNVNWAESSVSDLRIAHRVAAAVASFGSMNSVPVAVFL